MLSKIHMNKANGCIVYCEICDPQFPPPPLNQLFFNYRPRMLYYCLLEPNVQFYEHSVYNIDATIEEKYCTQIMHNILNSNCI